MKIIQLFNYETKLQYCKSYDFCLTLDVCIWHDWFRRTTTGFFSFNSGSAHFFMASLELKGYLWKSNHDFLNFVFDAVVFFWLFWNSATQQRHLNNSQFNNFSSSFSPRTIKQRTYVDIYIWVSSYASYFFFKLRIQYSEFSWIHLTITTITILRVWHFHDKKYLNSAV